MLYEKQVGSYDLPLYGDDNLAYSFPMISILRLPVNDLEALKNVDNVVDAAALNAQLTGALIQVEHRTALAPVQAQKTATELAQTFFFATVLILGADC